MSKRTFDATENEVSEPPKKRTKTSFRQNSRNTDERKQPDQDWICKNSWDFKTNGGLYSLSQLKESKKFFTKYGFCVIDNIITDEERKTALGYLFDDLNEICNADGRYYR